MLKSFNRAVGTFNNFENFQGADHNKKQRQKLSWAQAQWHREIDIFQVYYAEKTVFLERVFQVIQTFHFGMLVWSKLVVGF